MNKEIQSSTTLINDFKESDVKKEPSSLLMESDGFNSEYIQVVDEILETSRFSKDFVDTNSIIEGETVKNKIIEKYEDLKASSTLLRVKVSDADNEGNLYVPISDGVLGIVKNEDVNGQPYDPRKRAVFVGRSMLSIVKEVNRSTSTIHFSHITAKNLYRDYLRENLKEGMTVTARVRHVDNKSKRVYIDIEGCNLWGYVPINAWSYGYIYDPEISIKKNTQVSVVIKNHYKPVGNKKEVYICSRKDTMPNPWINIEKRYQRNSIILVQCCDLHMNKFFAKIPSMPGFDLDVYCEYPENKNKPDNEKIIIKLGHYYKVRVYDVSESQRKLKARVISEYIPSSNNSTPL